MAPEKKSNNNLKKLRESLGLMQKEFAKELGLADTTYNNYELGTREPKSKFWENVSKKYNVTVDYLMGFTDTPNAVAADKEQRTVLLNPAEYAFIKKYRNLDNYGRKAVDSILEVEYDRIGSKAPIINSPSKIKCYLTLAAICYMSPEREKDYYMLDPPEGLQRASFAFCVSGDSMEPYYKDGSIVYVKRSPRPSNGDVGVFLISNDVLCMKYEKDSKGNIHLLSLNSKYDDIVIDANSGISFKCLGKVL